MNTSNWSTKKVLKYLQTILGKFVSKLQSIFCHLKIPYKTLVLVIIVAVISIAGTSLVSILLSQSSSEVYLPSLGTIKTFHVETYWDQNAEDKRETIVWDELRIETISANEIKMDSLTTVVYVKSVSNVRASLNVSLSDWNPVEISDYLTISWEYDDTVMNPGEVIPVTMTLSSSSPEALINYLIETETKQFEVLVHFVASD